MLMVLPAWSDQVTLAQLMHHVSRIPETEDIPLNKRAVQCRPMVRHLY